MFRHFLKNPGRVAALFSSSSFCANAIVDLIPKDAKVLEVGAGTGAITKYLVKNGFTPDQLTICEYDHAMYLELKDLFPSYQILWQDAGLLDQVLETESFDVIISAVPVTTFSQDVVAKRLACYQSLLKTNGTLLQLTFFGTSPYKQIKGNVVKYVPLNFPPMFIWKYVK